MPNRLLREGILSSEPVNALPPEAEVFYRRVMSAVDDFGRYSAHPALLRAALYPLQLTRVSESHVSRHLAACNKAGLVRLYTRESKPYLELLKFGQHVRAKSSKFPAPLDRCTTDALHQNSTCQTGAPGDGDGDGDGYIINPAGPEGRKGKPTPPADVEAEKRAVETFTAFWAQYPRRVGKVPAERAWRTHGCADLLEQILVAVEFQRNLPDWQKEDGRFIPHPSTWINQHRWKDEGVVHGLNGSTKPKRCL